ncbi:hypothetical protein [Rheinheimera sp. WS51]|uniref:hypothetical protein n=1 Tax=Rheinheimera sp. WS51 TaxID=3425886 RepID=UPI003D92BC1D
MNNSKRLLRASRKYHKWLMAFIGIQFVIWAVSGAYMVYLDIDYIHGDTLVNNAQDKINPSQIDYPLQSLIQRYPEAKQISLGRYLDKTVYRFTLDNAKRTVDASMGEEIPALNQAQAEQAANYYYSGKGQIKNSELISETAPYELNPAVMPAWRVNFTDFGSPAIYVSAETGLLVGKRHSFWRLFDWMFRFHVMDYEGGAVDNTLLFFFTFLGILSSIFGLCLVYFRVFRKNNSALTEPAAAKNTTEGVA